MNAALKELSQESRNTMKQHQFLTKDTFLDKAMKSILNYLIKKLGNNKKFQWLHSKNNLIINNIDNISAERQQKKNSQQETDASNKGREYKEKLHSIKKPNSNEKQPVDYLKTS